MKRQTGGHIMTVHKSLYRDPRHGKISGVCAGVANYFELEAWLVRIIVLSATLLGGGFLVILAYIALSLMLEKQPEDYDQTVQMQREHKLKSRPWKQGASAHQLLHNLSQELDKVEVKVCQVEAYVTSDAFKVNKAFRDL
ncbi:envelope stress response membrane protein PspC [Vibrio gazogenes]|uniref:Phage shock protein C n=1 Tax=Vibrio gazogenes TaxID=687 RepID=A0A1Z2SIS0_VIBGA|nr:phage shock protein C [Vibrio gazogenes]